MITLEDAAYTVITSARERAKEWEGDHSGEVPEYDETFARYLNECADIVERELASKANKGDK